MPVEVSTSESRIRRSRSDGHFLSLVKDDYFPVQDKQLALRWLNGHHYCGPVSGSQLLSLLFTD